MLRANVVLLSTVAWAGCAAKPALAPQAAKVALSDEAPPADHVKIRALSVQSGKGCGLLAERGSREDADQKLRIAAEKLGATYVHVTGRREPGPNHLCLEHEYQVSGVAYRRRAPAAPPRVASTPPAPVAPPAPVPSLPHRLLDFEDGATLGKPARSTERSRVALSLAPGEGGGTALSIAYQCSGAQAEGLLDVHYELDPFDLRSAKVVSLRVKPDSPLSLSVSFWDDAGARYIQQTGQLPARVWQTVELPVSAFHPHREARVEADTAGKEPSSVIALVIAPHSCGDGHFLLDDVRAE